MTSSTLTETSATAVREILVVEDSDHFREWLVESIGDLDNVTVESSVDGLAAFEKILARSRPYDLIVTDISMPRMDGETLLRKLRDEKIPTPTIMLTAHGQDDIIVRCLRLGAADYLVKPVNLDDLMTALNTALMSGENASLPINVEFSPSGWFEISGGSDYSVLYRYRRFLSLLGTFRLPERMAAEIRLVIEELGRNAIEWGNQHNLEKRVRFACRLLPGKIMILIEDEGPGFSPEAVPDPSTDPLGHVQRRQDSGKRMGGYGIHMVKGLMDKVVWNEKGNAIMAIKYLGAKPQTEEPGLDSPDAVKP